MTAEPVLLPCPFCGGAAEIEETQGFANPEEVRFSVGCTNDICVAYQMFDTHARRSEAIKAWNTRHTPTPPETAEALSDLPIIDDVRELVRLYDAGDLKMFEVWRKLDFPETVAFFRAALRSPAARPDTAEALERLVNWCLEHSISTGHADNMTMLLDEILPQLSAHIETLIITQLSQEQGFKNSLNALLREQPRHDPITAQERYEEGYVNGWNHALERAALQSPPRIKPLVWVDGEYLSSAWALGPVRYKAQFSVTGNAWDLFLGDVYLSEHGEREQAKSAAEVHYEKTIRECLE